MDVNNHSVDPVLCAHLPASYITMRCSMFVVKDAVSVAEVREVADTVTYVGYIGCGFCLLCLLITVALHLRIL